jgi:thiamine biosynthesis lipoprotein
LGPQPDDQPWQIGLQDPKDPGKSTVEVPLSHGALATSGDYERYVAINGTRYSHSLNPHTGWPVVGLSSVTALAPQCMVAGSLTTIAMLKGRAGIPWLADIGLPHFWVDQNGRRGGSLPPIQ